MHRRINVATDVAMIGLWDVSRNDGSQGPSTDFYGEADEAHLFILQAGADWSGAVSLYVDQELPADVLKTIKPVGREFLVAVPTGQLIVGGVDDYRAATPRVTGADSIVTVPAGDYRVRCYRGPDDDETVAASEAEIRKAVGEKNVRYYDRINGCNAALGCATPIVLFAALCFVIRWFFALPIAFVGFIAYFHVAKWFLDRNLRYSQLGKQIDAMRLTNQPPTFVFELRRTTDRQGLAGGTLRADG